MDNMKKYIETNRSLWDGWTEINKSSDLYDLDGFKAGKNKLKSIELEELTDWARMGAKVTGVDFSPKAISLARSLSEELSIPARFIETELYEIPNALKEKFDIVFTSYGILAWISNIEKWADLIAGYLKPGGKLEYPYFHSPEPMKFVAQGNYADPDHDFKHDSYEWMYGIGEAATALIKAGLEIEYLHEFPYSPTNCCTFFTEDSPGRYVIKNYPNLVPLTFSIRATLK